MTKQSAKSASSHIAYAIPNVDKIRSRIMQAKIKATKDDDKFRQGCNDILKDCERVETRLDQLKAYLIEKYPEMAAPEDE